MGFPTNTGLAVTTFQKSGLATLLNSCAVISTFNKKFLNFQNMTANLGSSVDLELPPRVTVNNSLVWVPQGVALRPATLTVNQSCNFAYPMTAQDLIFTFDKAGESYLPSFAKAGIAEIAATVEADVSRNFISGVINGNINSPSYGQPNTLSGPYRFYGDGRTPINSYQQLAQIEADMVDFGVPKSAMFKHYLPVAKVPAIIGSGLNQFAPRRNDMIADSWMIGEFGTPPVHYYQSNLLPIHYSGTTGNLQQTLTLISVNDPTGANVTQLTFSGASGTDANAVKAGDLFEFQDGVSGQTNIRFRTFTGHQPSEQPVQFRATANAASDGSGHVTITVTPVLCWVASNIQNLTVPLNPGMQVLGLPDHRAGCMIAGDAGFLAMPRLPSQEPFISATDYDEETGASIRCTHGALLGQNATLFGYDILWDSLVIQEYSIRTIWPL